MASCFSQVFTVYQTGFMFFIVHGKDQLFRNKTNECEGILYSIQVISIGLNSWMDFIENFMVKYLTMVSVLSTKLL